MTTDEKDFMKAEFETAWQMIIAIDNRRGLFFRYYSLIYLGVIGASVAVLKEPGKVVIEEVVLLSLLYSLTSVVGKYFKDVLRSERKANVRYRGKINLIRRKFLETTVTDSLKDYRDNKNYKDKYGVKLDTDENQPEGDGTTLTCIFKMIDLSMWSLLFMAVALWIYFVKCSAST